MFATGRRVLSSLEQKKPFLAAFLFWEGAVKEVLWHKAGHEWTHPKGSTPAIDRAGQKRAGRIPTEPPNCYTGYMKNLSNKDYSSVFSCIQPCLPMDVGVLIPKDDSVRLLVCVLKQLNLKPLYEAKRKTGGRCAASWSCLPLSYTGTWRASIRPGTWHECADRTSISCGCPPIPRIIQVFRRHILGVEKRKNDNYNHGNRIVYSMGGMFYIVKIF
jgi:hypothetical protein